MTISRRELYAAGLPLGDGATVQKMGGGYRCGIGGDSSSQSNPTTNNIDKRVAVQGGAGVSGDNNVTQITDSGIVTRALDSIDKSNALQGDGFTALLATAGNMFSASLQTQANATQQVAAAYQTATNEKGGTLDNKTIIVLAVTGAAALAFATRK